MIFGVGGVGLLLIKIAKILGIKSITVVDIHKEKLDKATELGASKTILFTDKNQTSHSLLEHFDSKFPTVAIDTTGNTLAIEICYEISAPNAKVILVGVPKHGKKASIYTLPLHFGKILKGSEGGHSRPETDIPYLLKLIESEILYFNDYPTQTYSLNQVNDAISQLKSFDPSLSSMHFNFSTLNNLISSTPNKLETPTPKIFFSKTIVFNLLFF